METVVAAAGRALALGDPLAALTLIALRNDAAALALRGIAMAQLGDLARARALVRRAARAFGRDAVVARAKCTVAEAEIALAARDLTWPVAALTAAQATLDARGDRANAAYARTLQARHLLLLGRLDEAERALARRGATRLPAAVRTVREMVVAGAAIRRLRAKAARAAVARARRTARETGIPALIAEVESLSRTLDAPAARVLASGEHRLVRLEDVERLLARGGLVVDACSHGVRAAGTMVSLARRPVLFALARMLGEAWPGDVRRDLLVARAFGVARADASHRARLRVEIGRLRAALGPVARVQATTRGYALAPSAARGVVVLAPPVEERHADVLALLGDGESWSSSALALALGASQRTVQRALGALAAGGKARASGRGRARRWTAPAMPGITTTLLLPATFPVE